MTDKLGGQGLSVFSRRSPSQTSPIPPNEPEKIAPASEPVRVPLPPRAGEMKAPAVTATPPSPVEENTETQVAFERVTAYVDRDIMNQVDEFLFQIKRSGHWKVSRTDLARALYRVFGEAKMSPEGITNFRELVEGVRNALRRQAAGK
jgi:hypothetical protein